MVPKPPQALSLAPISPQLPITIPYRPSKNEMQLRLRPTIGHIPSIHFQSLPTPLLASLKPKTGLATQVQPRRLSEWAIVSQMQDYLSYYLNWYGTVEDTYQIDVRPISFPKGQDRINQSSGHDMSTLALYTDFLRDLNQKELEGKCPLHFGFFCTSPSWVGRGDGWKTEPWHCQASLTISLSKAKGVHCLIQDCNAATTFRNVDIIRRRSLRFRQHSFILQLPKTSRV